MGPFHLDIKQLAAGAYAVTGATLASSALVLLAPEGALLIDALGSTGDAAELRRQVEEGWRSRVHTIVLTHCFSDHMAALRLFPDAEVVAHADCLATFGRERRRTAEEAGFYVQPTRLLTGATALEWGGRRVDIFPNPGYTGCSLGIDLADLDLVHAGDTVVGAQVFLTYAEPALLRTALLRLAGLRRAWVARSHEGVAPAACLGHALHYLDELARRCGKAWETGGLDVEAASLALTACLAPGAAAGAGAAAYHRQTLEAVRDRGLFRPRPAPRA